MSATAQPASALSAELALSVEHLLKGVVLSATGLVLPEHTEFEQWLKIGRDLDRVQNATSWALGDWWAFGEVAGRRPGRC